MAKINEIDDQRDSSRGQSSTFAPTLPHPIGASSTFNRTDTFGHEHVPGQDETQAFTPGLSGTGPGGGSDSGIRSEFLGQLHHSARVLPHRYPPPDASKFSEYEKKYPPDKYGEELKSNARVFKVYRDVVVDQDNLLLHGWHETLNVILIFAGLFSAILTGFSSKQLRPDNSEITAKAVLAILARFEGVNGTNAASISTPFVPPPGAIAVNRAWFASLSLALTVSLVAILAKQWLLEYTSTMRSSTGDARGWAWRHVMLRDGLSKWGINALISWLAVFLHISLFLFFGGLAVFVRGLDAGVYVFMVILTTSTVVLYCASFIAPLIWPECPSGTHFHKNVPGWFPPLFDGVVETTFTLATAILDILLGSPTEYFWIGSILSWAKKLRHRPIRLNLRVVSSEEHRLTVAALKWMIDPDTRLPDEAVVVAVDAIGAIDVQLHRAVYGDRNPLRSKQ
ncbi:hypothetical protein BKA62DRAFT_775110 [Auriculariales sp. MPI-PUGE-AT-0066]|nr:hypothetical protein BKA62DRAFT_775110 [Auriculariales sp. MPI-PUGE-AT-0066]